MSRQRYVYPTDEIPHLWAHKTQDEARNPQHNFYFRGDTIYSYGTHFPIARHVKARGKECVFFTTDGYSSTTGQHKWSVRRSIPGGVKVIEVPKVFAKINEVLAYQKKQVKDYILRLAKSVNAPQRKKRFRELEAVIRAAKDFCQFFGYSDKFAVIPANMEEIAAKAKADIKRAAAADAKRRAKAEETRRLADEKYINEELPEIIAKWRAGQPGHFRGHLVPMMLRVREDEVETTLGVTFPVRHALKVMPLVAKLLATGKTFQTNGHKIRLGHYELESIDENGTVTAGCHVIPKDEVLRLIGELQQPQYANMDLNDPVEVGGVEEETTHQY